MNLSAFFTFIKIMKKNENKTLEKYQKSQIKSKNSIYSQFI